MNYYNIGPDDLLEDKDYTAVWFITGCVVGGILGAAGMFLLLYR